MRRLVARIMAAIACALLLSAHLALAGAFLENAGHGQVIVSGTFSDSADDFDASGKIVPLALYRKFELTANAEYGLTDWLTVILASSLINERDHDAPMSSYAGLGTSELGGRVRLFANEDSVVSFQTTLRIPGSFDRSNPILIGTQSVGADWRLLYGRSFQLGGWASFVDAEAGYRLVGAGAPNEFHVDLTFGTRPRADILLLLQSFSVISDGAGTLLPSMQSHKVEGSLVYSINPTLDVQVGLFATIAAVNQRRERGIVTALWQKF